jgi:hypothetical protein
MRPLNRGDYLLILIVVSTAVAGFCALLVVIMKVLEEVRERRADRAARKAAPAGMLKNGRRPYRVSIVRH